MDEDVAVDVRQVHGGDRAGRPLHVRVGEAELPEVGDARQWLRVAFTGETADGEQTLLSLDVAVVRVGDDTIALTHGGPGEVSADATTAFVQVGVQRLADVRKQARLPV